MFKQSTVARVQGAYNMATQIINQQQGQAAASGTPEQPAGLMSPDGVNAAILGLASLLLEEDDRQNRSLVVPAPPGLKL